MAEQNQDLKKPFTDEQQDLLMDYLFEKYMNDMMKSKERSEDFYNQPPTTDPEGNVLMQASLPGNLNKRETELLMESSPVKKTLPGNLNKNELEMLMGLIDQGVKDTKKEGIMMARDDRIGTLMNLLEAERMSDNPDLDKIREYEGELFNLMSPRRAADGGIVSLSEGGDPLYEMFEEVWENTPASERATGSVKKATVRVTGDPLSYRNFLKDLGFIKTAEAADVKALGKYGVKIGDEIGSISAAAKALKIKPFELRTEENFAKLIDLAKQKGIKEFKTVTGAGKASISAVEDAATGIGFRGADPGKEKIKFNQVLAAEQKDLNKIFGNNPSKAKSFEFVKRLSSAYPTLAKGAGLTALLSAAAKNAFGGPLLDLAIPTEMGMGTLMSPEEEALLLDVEKIKETFK